MSICMSHLFFLPVFYWLRGLLLWWHIEKVVFLDLMSPLDNFPIPLVEIDHCLGFHSMMMRCSNSHFQPVSHSEHDPLFGYCNHYQCHCHCHCNHSCCCFLIFMCKFLIMATCSTSSSLIYLFLYG